MDEKTSGLSFRSKVVKLMKDRPAAWVTPKEMTDWVPGLKIGNAYTTLSSLFLKDEILERRHRAKGGGYEYRLKPEAIDGISIESAGGKSDKVYWTEEEKRAFAKEYYRLVKENPKKTKTTLNAEAQGVIQPHRRRPPLGLYSPWLNDYLEDESQRFLHDMEKEEKDQEIPEPPAPSQQIEPQFEHVPVAEEPKSEISFETVIPSEEQLKNLLSTANVTDLFGEVMDRMTLALKKVILDVLTSPEVVKAMTVNVNVNHQPATTDEQTVKPAVYPFIERRHNPSMPTTHKDIKKRVLIVGLLNGQVQEIQKEFSGKLDVRYWTKDEKINTLRSKAGQADYTILVTDFISHSHQDAVKNLGIKFRFHSGGMTRLREMLFKLCNGIPI